MAVDLTSSTPPSPASPKTFVHLRFRERSVQNLYVQMCLSCPVPVTGAHLHARVQEQILEIARSWLLLPQDSRQRKHSSKQGPHPPSDFRSTGRTLPNPHKGRKMSLWSLRQGLGSPAYKMAPQAEVEHWCSVLINATLHEKEGVLGPSAIVHAVRATAFSRGDTGHCCLQYGVLWKFANEP